MTINELKAKLSESSVKWDNINILSKEKDYAMNLVFERSHYVVFYMEKGCKTPLGIFENLEDAADAFWACIEKDWRYFFNET